MGVGKTTAFPGILCYDADIEHTKHLRRNMI
jgi:hypothetical protein